MLALNFKVIFVSAALFSSLGFAQIGDVSVEQFGNFARQTSAPGWTPVHESMPQNLFPEPIYRSKHSDGTPRFGATLTEKYIHATGETISVSSVFELTSIATRKGFVSLRIAIRGRTGVTKLARVLKALVRRSKVSSYNEEIEYYSAINGAFVDIQVDRDLRPMLEKIKAFHGEVTKLEEKGLDAYLAQLN